jgi:hypothetical protein
MSIIASDAAHAVPVGDYVGIHIPIMWNGNDDGVVTMDVFHKSRIVEIGLSGLLGQDPTQ